MARKKAQAAAVAFTQEQANELLAEQGWVHDEVGLIWRAPHGDGSKYITHQDIHRAIEAGEVAELQAVIRDLGTGAA